MANSILLITLISLNPVTVQCDSFPCLLLAVSWDCWCCLHTWQRNSLLKVIMSMPRRWYFHGALHFTMDPPPRCKFIEISGQLWKGDLSSLVYRWETQWGNLPQGHMVSNWYGPNAVQDSWLPISLLDEFWAIQFEISSITVDSNKHMDRSVLSTGIFQLNVFEGKDWIFKDKAGREITGEWFLGLETFLIFKGLTGFLYNLYHICSTVFRVLSHVFWQANHSLMVWDKGYLLVWNEK